MISEELAFNTATQLYWIGVAVGFLAGVALGAPIGDFLRRQIKQ